MATGRRTGALLREEVSFSSTEAQNRFGEVLRIVQEGGRVVVERRGHPQAVILPVAALRELEQRAETSLGELEDRFDLMLEEMQGEGALAALDRALASGPEALAFRLSAPRQG